MDSAWIGAVIGAVGTALAGVIAATGAAFWKRHRAKLGMRQEDQEDEVRAIRDYQGLVREMNRKLKRAEDRSDEQRKATDAIKAEHLRCREEYSGLYQFMLGQHHITCLIRDELVNMGGRNIQIPPPPPMSDWSDRGEFLDRQAAQSERLAREVDQLGDDDTKP